MTITRRTLLRGAAAGAAVWIGSPARSAEPEYPVAKAVTSGPNHHFFGYYDKIPWDKSGRYLLGMRSTFVGRQPKAGEELALGRIDRNDGDRWLPFAVTQAWCWQQGTMLQWLPGTDASAIHNGTADGKFVSVIHNFADGSRRTLPRPIYCVSNDGKQAISLNFARLARCRPGYGYEGVADSGLNDRAPADDGLLHVNLTTGESKLIFSQAQATAFKPRKDFEGATHWFNHCQFNPSGSRFVFLHRWGEPGKKWTTRCFTISPDGSNPRLLADYGMTSHFDWRDDNTLLAWARGPKGDRFYLIGDGDDRFDVMGEGTLVRDGHCSFSPDRKWVLNDTYPEADQKRTLMLYRPADGKRIDIGRFHSPPALNGPWRCDLHPRWNRDGTQVCIDSAHETTRQLYVIDVSKIVG